MAYDLTDKLVIGISSRALFDLERENGIYQSEGVAAYCAFQRQHEDEPLQPGTAFPLVQALLGLNNLIPGRRLVEVVVISRNSPDTGLRAFNAIETHRLDITRAAFTGGEPIAPYLKAFKVDLFLSREASDVQAAIDGGVAAAQLYAAPAGYHAPAGQIRIAFDGDAVLFSPESEQIFKQKGLEAFIRHEQKHRHKAMAEGPFAKLLLRLAEIQSHFKPGQCPVRIAIVTARNSPAHTRVVHTLRAWNVSIDEAFFLGGLPKDQVLQAFGAHMFFDDQEGHVALASVVVPSGRVPYKGGELGGGKRRPAARKRVGHAAEANDPAPADALQRGADEGGPGQTAKAPTTTPAA
ncbi:5'-nucleotidase [Cupriavidus basilensis]|uniref:5'-nucleotidase n=1 Tax=Cupriavidus basilensis TaxID=68895 RepID=A0ABT6B2A3_9BURK|nr:5'-nucleotidase [Cupriavidus basilensis]MDF3838854.1 5'-nucleotidase [Cupriavidus basilensis]